MSDINKQIIFVRSYNGALVPIDKVKLVTVDPNTAKIIQEIPLLGCIERLIHINMHNYEATKNTLDQLYNDDYLNRT